MSRKMRCLAVLLAVNLLMSLYVIFRSPLNFVKRHGTGQQYREIGKSMAIIDEKQKSTFVVEMVRQGNQPDNIANETQVAVNNTKANSRPDIDFVEYEYICPQYSLWTKYLIVPRQISNLEDWSFNKRTKCPKFKLDKYPSVRQKIALQCNGRHSTLMTSTAKSTNDITSVPFGDVCLSDVIDNCCSGNKTVPNVVHYVWYANKEVAYFHFVSFMSALRFIKPCLFLFHGQYVPRGKYWNYFVSISPNIIHVLRDTPTSVFGQKLAYEEHASDIMRIEALHFYGGIYLDTDEIVLRSLDPLRKFAFTQGQEDDMAMGSQLIMAEKNATFLKHWYRSYRDNYKKTWAWNALYVPGLLAKRYPDLIRVEGYNFTRPNWNYTDLLFNRNYDWSTNYAMHMYSRWYKHKINNIVIRTLNTTIGSVARYVILGNKELCYN